ncbi:MAG: hypothetical protein CALGDGBN_02645 [Pseudomonadales bacterium]|nr:hypothetical protein [Pseudomonadales bacterium]
MLASLFPLRNFIVRRAFDLQKLLLAASCFVFRWLRYDNPEKRPWVVGVDEVAANVFNIGEVLTPAIKVSFSRHPFYDYKYDHCPSVRNRFLLHLVRLFYGPVLLGYLVNRSNSFFYVGGSGFLVNEVDGRDYEFSFLRKRSKTIACYFCGSEIRSIKLMEAFSRQHDMDVVTTYQVIAQPFIASDYRERIRYLLATSANRHADHIFNAPVDQMSYIERTVHPFMYFHPARHFRKEDDKFAGTGPLKILHAPSSPLIKGTPLVRAAIKKLKLEGYPFEYRELIGASNTVVLEELRNAHIVLNEFYAFVPGQFGIEAMAAHCALLTSADEHIEPSLPAGSNQAWCVTRYWEIYDKLKALLDSPDLIKAYADAGYGWAEKYSTYEASSRRLRRILGLGGTVE